MQYIISGASRSGKSIVARQIASSKGIPYLSLDWIMMGFTNGIPEYGVHDKLWPDEIAERLWGFLKAMFESMIYTKTDCVIEGEAILPDLIKELMIKYPDEIRICFLGFTKIDPDVKEYFEEHSVRLHALTTNEAVELYNELDGSGVPVGGAFHLTC